MFWFCCECGHGPQTFSPACPYCSSARCHNCRIEEHIPKGRDLPVEDTDSGNANQIYSPDGPLSNSEDGPFPGDSTGNIEASQHPADQSNLVCNTMEEDFPDTSSLSWPGSPLNYPSDEEGQWSSAGADFLVDLFHLPSNDCDVLDVPRRQDDIVQPSSRGLETVSPEGLDDILSMQDPSQGESATLFEGSPSEQSAQPRPSVATSTLSTISLDTAYRGIGSEQSVATQIFGRGEDDHQQFQSPGHVAEPSSRQSFKTRNKRKRMKEDPAESLDPDDNDQPEGKCSPGSDKHTVPCCCLACPFVKFDPRWVMVRPTCAKSGFPTIHRLK